MSCAGVQRSLSTGTANRDTAAQIARDWYVFLSRERSWAAFDARYRNPEPAPNRPGLSSSGGKNAVTIGDYLAAVRAESDLAHKTIADYQRALRTVVSGVLAMGTKGKARRHAKHRSWRTSIDATPLESITSDKVRLWQRAYINRAGDDELARRRYTVTCNSYLRRSKALFSKRVLTKLRSVKLSEPLPFEGIESGGRPDSRFYGIAVPIEELVSSAVAELDTEPLKVFVLALGLGLRRREIDTLEWSAVDFINATLTVRPTAAYGLKSHASASVLPIEQEILTLLRGWRSAGAGRFIVESHNLPTSGAYRCEPVFQSLIDWLRQKGVSDVKPMHALRKCFGSRIALQFGIHAASSALRHRDISTTSSFYVDSRPKATAGIGPLLSGKEIPITELKKA